MANYPATEIPRLAGGYFAGATTPSINGFFATTSSKNMSRPTIENISPLSGLGRSQHVFFDVVDDSGLFAALVIGVSFSGSSIPDEFVYCLAAFANRFRNSSIVQVTGTRKRFEIARVGVWPANPTFLPIAVDQDGNINA